MKYIASAALCAVLFVSFGSAAFAAAKITGISFVDNSVTAMGSRAKLPPGAKIYPSGSTITGTTGCPTDRYGTTGLIVTVIDYAGPPTAASLQVTRHPASGGSFQDAPYYIDLDAGRTLQYLGPIFANGTYSLHFEAGFEGLNKTKLDASFKLDRSCQRVQ